MLKNVWINLWMTNRDYARIWNTPEGNRTLDHWLEGSWRLEKCIGRFSRGANLAFTSKGRFCRLKIRWNSLSLQAMNFIYLGWHLMNHLCEKIGISFSNSFCNSSHHTVDVLGAGIPVNRVTFMRTKPFRFFGVFFRSIFAFTIVKWSLKIRICFPICLVIIIQD